MRRHFAPSQSQAADPEALARTNRQNSSAPALGKPTAVLSIGQPLASLPQTARAGQVVALSRIAGNRATTQLLQRSWADSLWNTASGMLGGQPDDGAPQGNNPVVLPEMEIPASQPSGDQAGGGPMVMPEMDIPMPQPGGGGAGGGPMVLPEMEIPTPQPGGGGPVELPEMEVPTEGGGLWNQMTGAANDLFGSLW